MLTFIEYFSAAASNDFRLFATAYISILNFEKYKNTCVKINLNNNIYWYTLLIMSNNSDSMT